MTHKPTPEFIECMGLTRTIIKAVEPMVDVQTFRPTDHLFLSPTFHTGQLWLTLDPQAYEGRTVIPRVQLHAHRLDLPEIGWPVGFYNVFSDEHGFSADLVAKAVRESADFSGKWTETWVLKREHFATGYLTTIYRGSVVERPAPGVQLIDIEYMRRGMVRPGLGERLIWPIEDLVKIVADARAKRPEGLHSATEHRMNIEASPYGTGRNLGKHLDEGGG